MSSSAINSGGINTATAPAYPSPLWIIALFIALSEVTAGIAAIATSGSIAGIFAVFTVVFPILIFGVFIWLLLAHPGNLYSPWQYTEQTSIEGYIGALSRQSQRTSLVIGQAIGGAVVTATSTSLSGDDAAGRETIREQVVESFDRILAEASITVDRSSVAPGLEPVQIPVTDDTSVDELLDSVYFAISPTVKPFSYNKSWMLTLMVDGEYRPLTEIGTQWAKSKDWQRDERSITNVGVTPGSHLRVDLLG